MACGLVGMAGVDGDIEDVMEANRPPQYPRRDAVIYMASNLRTLENVARSADYIYLMKPLSPPLMLVLGMRAAGSLDLLDY